MDYVRSCYRTKFVFRTGDAPLDVEWRFADDSAGLFPLEHNFFSSNWDARKAVAGWIGEQPGAKPWIRGTRLGRGQATYNCEGIDSWWKEGIPVGQQAPEVDAEGVPLCCVPSPGCCNCPPGETVTATFINSFGADCLDGLVVVLSQDPDTCDWYGTADTDCDGCEINLHLSVSDLPPDTCGATVQLSLGFFCFSSYVVGWDCSGSPDFPGSTTFNYLDCPDCGISGGLFYLVLTSP